MADNAQSLLFDPVTGELQVTDTVSFVSGSEGVAQSLRHRLRLFKGEFFADLNAGVDYYGKVLGTKFSEARVRAAFREEILAEPDVTEIVSLTATYDKATRETTVTWRVRTVYSTTPVDGSLTV